MRVCILKMILIMIVSHFVDCVDLVCVPLCVCACLRKTAGSHLESAAFSLFNMQHAIYVPSLLWEGYAALVIISDLVVYLFPSNTSNCSGHPQLFKQRSVEDSLIQHFNFICAGLRGGLALSVAEALCFVRGCECLLVCGDQDCLALCLISVRCGPDTSVIATNTYYPARDWKSTCCH